jgi:hypothetical protein
LQSFYCVPVVRRGVEPIAGVVGGGHGYGA